LLANQRSAEFIRDEKEEGANRTLEGAVAESRELGEVIVAAAKTMNRVNTTRDLEAGKVTRSEREPPYKLSEATLQTRPSPWRI
jgi:hypothetical protein